MQKNVVKFGPTQINAAIQFAEYTPRKDKIHRTRGGTVYRFHSGGNKRPISKTVLVGRDRWFYVTSCQPVIEDMRRRGFVQL